MVYTLHTLLFLAYFALKLLRSMNIILDNLKRDLISNADEKTKQSGERFFKEEVKFYGIKSAVVGRIAKDHFKLLEDKSKSHVFFALRGALEIRNNGRIVCCMWLVILYQKGLRTF